MEYHTVELNESHAYANRLRFIRIINSIIIIISFEIKFAHFFFSFSIYYVVHLAMNI